MNFAWSTEQFKIKNEIVHKATVLKMKKVCDFMHYDPYLLVDNCYDVFLLFAKLKLVDVCIYFIKSKKYNNRYFSNGKSTLYYLITSIQNIKILYEIFIYWKLNSFYFELLEQYHAIENFFDILIYYYLNNNVCPCVIYKDSEIIKNCLLFKNFKHMCHDCLNIFINTNHTCTFKTMKSITTNNYVIQYICQNLNCNDCLNHFMNMNSLPLIKKLVVNKKIKTWNDVIFSAVKIKCAVGEFEDSIDIDTIATNEKYYKCTSLVPHYYKYENWIAWSNQKNVSFYDQCCICKLKMDNHLYINNENNNDEMYFKNRSDKKICRLQNKTIIQSKNVLYYLE